MRRPPATKRPEGGGSRLESLDGAPIGGFTNVGGLTEQMVLDERGVIKIDDDVPLDLASILGCAVVTGLGAVFNVAHVQPGDSVAVIGCGGVGLNVIQGARIAGATTIIAVDMSSESKLDGGPRARCHTRRQCRHRRRCRRSAAIADGLGVDHAFEVIGRPATVEQALAMAANGRNAYVVGVMADEALIAVRAEYTKRGKSLRGVYMGNTQPHVDIPRYVELWRARPARPGRMVTRRLAARRCQRRFPGARRRRGQPRRRGVRSNSRLSEI